MTLEEFKVKYKFAKNMTHEDLKQYMMFMVMFMMKLAIDDKSDIMVIMEDIMQVTKSKIEIKND